MMRRIDRSRLAGARFPQTLSVATRWGDLDMQGHVNNAAAMVILQEGRVRFNQFIGLPAAMGDLRAMVVGLAVEYAAELHHPEPVEVQTGVLEIGRSSFTVGQVIRQNDQPAIYAEAALVMANVDGATPLPEPLRATLETMRIVSAYPPVTTQ